MRAATISLMFLTLAACGAKDGDTSDTSAEGTGAAATVEEVCAKVFSCDGWGWEDQATCEAGFLGSAAYQTECASEAGYLSCVADCLNDDCEPFAACEGACWTSSC
ncbi:MAG: hypothetical protein JXX28_03465 [Deltaproteobacteria bacterium]|nr:hypothetical protein [Deltaproteobacteria bacterium]